MAEHTISGAIWPDGTTVGVYPAVSVPAGSDVPSGTQITSSVVSGGSVSFGGLTAKVRYYAYGGGKGVGFLVAPTAVSPQTGDRDRIEALEVMVAALETGEAGAGPGTAAVGASVESGGVYPARPDAELVIWVGAGDPPIGGFGGALDNVDLWVPR